MDYPKPACTITVTEPHQPSNSSHLTSAQCDEVICLIILDVAPSQLCGSLFVINRVATSCHPTLLFCPFDTNNYSMELFCRMISNSIQKSYLIPPESLNKNAAALLLYLTAPLAPVRTDK